MPDVRITRPSARAIYNTVGIVYWLEQLVALLFTPEVQGEASTYNGRQFFSRDGGVENENEG